MLETDACRTQRFWREAVPALTVTSRVLPSGTDRRDLGESLSSIEREGAAVVKNSVPRALCERLEEGILAARRAFGHEVFALMYDEPWRALLCNLSLLMAAMGDGVRAVPMPFVNYVPSGDSGFAPHRDRNHTPLAEDGTPNIMTVWTAVTPATTDRGCLAVLPIPYDPCFPDELSIVRIPDIRDLRSLPVEQGDAVVFNQAVVHMGTRNVTPHPRISFAIEVERGGLEGARSPGIRLGNGVGFEERLALIGTTVGALSQNNIVFDDRALSLAEAMSEPHPEKQTEGP